LATKSVEHRTKEEQIPKDEQGQRIVQTIISYFKNHKEREYAFEKCAKEVLFLADSNIYEIDLTRPWRDGGRDGLGLYKIGLP